MARWAQRHRDAATLEERRLSGLSLLHSGVSQAEVARRLGVSPVAVCRWKKRVDRGGPGALRAVPRPGRPPRIPRDRQATLPSILAKGALAYGFSTDLWTIPRIGNVVPAEWGIRYSHTAIWRLLKRHGLSWQKPRRRAREKDLRAVRNWTKRSWPRYKKSRPEASRRRIPRRERLLPDPVRGKDLGPGRPDPGAHPPGTVAQVLGDQRGAASGETVHSRAREHDRHSAGDPVPPTPAPPHPSAANHDLLGRGPPPQVERRLGLRAVRGRAKRNVNPDPFEGSATEVAKRLGVSRRTVFNRRARKSKPTTNVVPGNRPD